MGYGIYRRAPDYRRPRRAVLAVTAAVTVAPTLFVRPRPLLPQPPAHYHYYYQQARKRLPALPPPPPAVALSTSNKRRALSLSQLFRREWDYRAPRRATFVAPPIPPGELRSSPTKARALLFKPRVWDYSTRARLPPPTTAAITGAALVRQSITKARAALARVHPWNYATRAPARYRLPSVAPPVAVLRARTTPAYVTAPVSPQREVYARLRRLLPTVPPAGIITPARPKLNLYARTRTLYERARQELYYLPQKHPTVPTIPVVPSGKTLRGKVGTQAHVYRRLWDYASNLAKKLVPRYPQPPTAPALIKLTLIAGAAPEIDGLAGAAPKLDLIAGAAPKIDDITGKC